MKIHVPVGQAATQSPHKPQLFSTTVNMTTPNDDGNAIDPQCFVELQGRDWLVMGSNAERAGQITPP